MPKSRKYKNYGASRKWAGKVIVDLINSSYDVRSLGATKAANAILDACDEFRTWCTNTIGRPMYRNIYGDQDIIWFDKTGERLDV